MNLGGSSDDDCRVRCSALSENRGKLKMDLPVKNRRAECLGLSGNLGKMKRDFQGTDRENMGHLGEVTVVMEEKKGTWELHQGDI